MKVRKVSKLITSMILSAALLMEPVAGTAVYAEEVSQEEQQTDQEEIAGSESETSEDEQDSSDAAETGESVEKEGTEETEETAGQGSDTEEAEEAGDQGSDTEEAEETAVQESGTEETEETKVQESDTEEMESDQSDSYDFTGMPSSYCLTADQIEEKSVLANNIGDLNEEDEGEKYVARQVMTTADSRKEAEMIAKAYDAEIISYEDELLVMELDEDTSVCDAVEAAASDETNLPAVWPNYYRTIYDDDIDWIEIEESEYDLDEEAPTLDAYAEAYAADPNLSESEGKNYQWHHATIGSTYAWAEGYTGSDVKVAVLDCGVSGHEDVNVVDNINKASASSSTDDVWGHGTHVAGIIGATKDNGKGGAGVAPDAELYNIKVLGDDGSGSDADIYLGIRQAIDWDVDIINMSLGGVGYNDLMNSIITEAYEKGIAVIVSAGNDGASTKNYPACYDHVICVAATDNGNGRADFSTYGSWVDVSAPGVNIFSSCNAGKTGYTLMSGTSMACPVISGEAAVILSSDIITAEGSARVDQLESVMKKNTIKAEGSGMGAGIPSLTKIFGLATASSKPNAPVITIGTAENRQSVQVEIKAQSGMKICYTTDGTNPVYANGTAGGTADWENGNTKKLTIDCTKKDKGTIKAIAVNESGVVSAVKSQSYALKPWVTSITISGPARVEQGKTVQLAAAVTPAYATNKNVTWTVTTQDGRDVDSALLKIDAKGKLTVSAQAETGTYLVTAQAADEGRISQSYAVQVIQSGSTIQSLAFDSKSKELWITKTSAKPSESLSTALTAKEKDATGKTLKEIAAGELSSRITWTSSKPAVATVDAAGKVTAVAAGTTTITAKANDNGGKKATISIVVKQAVTKIDITTDKGQTKNLILAAGKSLALKAAVTPAKPANSKVNWSIEPEVDTAEDTGVSIAANGKITAKKGAIAGTYIVTAKADDGKGITATTSVKVCSGAIGSITLSKADSKVTIYTKQVDETRTNTATITAKIAGANGATDFDPTAYTVTNSNQDIIRVSSQGSQGQVFVTLTATGNGYGKSNVVIASTDGSNKKATCTVTVSGGITKVEIKDSAEDTGKKVSKLALFRQGTNNTYQTTLYAGITGQTAPT
jgi:subtilisin family serine protease